MVYMYGMYACAQDCGANLSADAGALASPNWPHNYAHHQHCVWNITVTRHKVCMCHCASVSMQVAVTIVCVCVCVCAACAETCDDVIVVLLLMLYLITTCCTGDTTAFHALVSVGSHRHGRCL